MSEAFGVRIRVINELQPGLTPNALQAIIDRKVILKMEWPG